MLDKNELLTRINAHEDNLVERKSRGVTPDELRKTASGFANGVPEGREAVLFVGIDDAGQITGIEDTDDFQKKLRGALENQCYPPIRYTVEVLQIGQKQVVAVVIPYSDSKPHFTGPAYMRVGSETKKASADLFEELVLSRVDKCREILKWKNQVVSVRGINYKVGSNKPLGDRHYIEHLECSIEGCDGHVVKLFDIARSEHICEAMSGITIAHDTAKRRLLLLVRFPA